MIYDSNGNLLNTDSLQKNLDSFGYSPDGADVLTTLWFSDIHADVDNLRRILAFKSKHPEIQDIWNTGDTIYRLHTDDYSWFANASGAEKILCAMGNHEYWKDATGSQQASMAECAAKFIDPFVSNWGLTNRPTGCTYYYKDYTAAKIRFIVVDNLSGNEKTAMISWLTTALNDAITKGYHVIVANHYGLHVPPRRTSYGYVEMVDCAFSPSPCARGIVGGQVPTEVKDCVDTFIDNGGVFICHLVGHLHNDAVGTQGISTAPSAYKRQMIFTITTASHERFQWNHNDIYRGSDEMQDAFNVLSFDTSAGVMKIKRIGANVDIFGRKRDMMSFDYIERKVIE